MKNALAMVQKDNVGYLKAAKVLNVRRTTLFHLCKTNSTADTRFGWKPVLLPELEQLLVSYLLEMEQRFFGTTRTNLKRMAFQLAKANNLLSPFKVNNEAASEY